MLSILNLLILAHLLGLALGVGAATVKLVLLFKCNSDKEFIPVFLKVVKPITKLIILGLIILTLSGIFWLIRGYPFTPLLTFKVILVGLIWILGPIIDNVIEPRFVKLALLPEEATSQAFGAVWRQYLALEISATSLFYVITILGVLV